MDWRFQSTGQEVAYSGQRTIGFAGAMALPPGQPGHGQWVWTLTTVARSGFQDDTTGYAADLAEAKAALEQRWRDWLEERGLVEVEEVARVLRDAMPKRRG